jgi:hypothetical protein
MTQLTTSSMPESLGSTMKSGSYSSIQVPVEVTQVTNMKTISVAIMTSKEGSDRVSVEMIFGKHIDGRRAAVSNGPQIIQGLRPRPCIPGRDHACHSRSSANRSSTERWRRARRIDEVDGKETVEIRSFAHRHYMLF